MGINHCFPPICTMPFFPSSTDIKDKNNNTLLTLTDPILKPACKLEPLLYPTVPKKFRPSKIDPQLLCLLQVRSCRDPVFRVFMTGRRRRTHPCFYASIIGANIPYQICSALSSLSVQWTSSLNLSSSQRTCSSRMYGGRRSVHAKTPRKCPNPIFGRHPRE